MPTSIAGKITVSEQPEWGFGLMRFEGDPDLVLAMSPGPPPVEVDLIHTVSFGENSPFIGQPAVPILSKMADVVEGVISAFEAELQRLGL